MQKASPTQPEANQSGEWRLYLYYVRSYWRPYWKLGVIAGAGILTMGIYRIIFAVSLKNLIDGFAASTGGLFALSILAKLLIGLPIILVITLASEGLAARISSRVANELRYDLFAHLQSLALDFYKNAKHGDILARFAADMPLVEQGLATNFIQVSVRLLTIFVNLLVLFWIEWHLALFTLVALPGMSYIMSKYSPKVTRANLALQKRGGQNVQALQEGLRAQAMIKSFGITQFIQDCYWQDLAQLEKTSTATIFQRAIFNELSMFLLLAMDISSFGLGLLLVTLGSSTIGALLAFQAIMMYLRREVVIAVSDMTTLTTTFAALRRVEQIFQHRVEIVDAPHALPLPPFQQTIRFEQVSFGYGGGAEQLQQIDLTIHAGQFVAIVGPSGAGKSTLLNLLLRFYDVTHGSIAIDGHDLRDVTQTSIRAQMGVVWQDTFIFNTTILNNIRVVKPDADENAVMAAAKSAELHDFIMSLPDGYQTRVGEQGGRLSGGQKQRIAIARAMLYNPRILLLDEATNSLDAETALAIHATLHALAQERTVIAITHSLASVINADMIYVLEQGRLVEQGQHSTLLAAHGLYAQLWRIQTEIGRSEQE